MLHLANWNLEWSSSRQKRHAIIEQLVHASSPDVACFTEINTDTVPLEGNHIFSDSDYGYPSQNTSRRKVMLSSSQPWTEIDPIGSDKLPPGRYISGLTHGIRFIGVCIPWHDAHVSTGQKNKQRWQDHLTYLQELSPTIQSYLANDTPLCIMGDYNQRIPKGWQPQHLLDALQHCFKDLTIHTTGITDPEDKHLIDHTATSPQMTYQIQGFYPKMQAPTKLSDHTGHHGVLNRAHT